MKCIVRPSGVILAQKVEMADSFLARLKGLMFRKELPKGCGLLLAPCLQIHTCFMRFATAASRK